MEIHEFLEIYGQDMEEGIIKAECMEMACEFLFEMACSDITAVKIILNKLYMHLLKYRLQPEKQSELWTCAIRDRSMQLSNFLEDMFLRKKITIEMQRSIYEHVVKWTEVDTRLPKESFPQSLPDEFVLENLIDIDYIHQYLRQYACYEKY